MKLPVGVALARLEAHDHGVLSTLHPVRGVDAVPVVYAVADEHVGVPIDRVKPKSSTSLQRERNLQADPRATLLVDRWDPDDWSRLWWVRVNLSWVTDEARSAMLARRLVERYRFYDDESFERVLVFRIRDVSGWAATDAES